MCSATIAFMMSDIFPASLVVARSRLSPAARATEDARRSRLDGAAGGLSPYLTHGLLSVPEVAASVAGQARQTGAALLRQLGRREYFQHVWHHLGDAILRPLQPGPRAQADYARVLPDDIRQARCGVPAIDSAVRQLYAQGWLHHQARLWLASYVVHVRGVHWRSGADWMLGHLLDGDLASNHLSWQCVAGIGSQKPGLFNAEQVAGLAAGLPGWASPGSVIDTRYEVLANWAFGQSPLPTSLPGPAPGAAGGAPAGQAEPPLWHSPPADLQAALLPPLPQTLTGRRVWLVHPWSLGDPPAGLPTGLPGDGPLRLGVWPAEHFAAWAWSAARWHFVAQRLAQLTDRVVWADTALLQRLLVSAASVTCQDNGHLPAAWPAAWRQPPPRLLADPEQLCASFSQFWRTVQRSAPPGGQRPGD